MIGLNFNYFRWQFLIVGGNVIQFGLTRILITEILLFSAVTYYSNYQLSESAQPKNGSVKETTLLNIFQLKV
jgi:hypothetical protein